MGRALVAISQLTAGESPFAAQPLVQWDSHLYLRIAESGLALTPCVVGGQPRWCGNTGWLPLYSYLTRWLSLTGLSLRAAAVAVAGLCALLFLVVLHAAWLREGPPLRRFLILVMAALFPGMIFQHAAFPTSLTLLLLAAGYAACAAGSRTAWLASALLPWSYATGFLSVAVPLAAAPSTRNVKAAIRFGLAGGAGFALLLGWYQMSVGHWDAFFLVQAQYGHGLHDPLAELWRRLAFISQGFSSLIQVATWQTLTVTVFVGATVVMGWRGRRRLTLLDKLVLTHLLVFWIFPLVMGSSVSIYRSEALLAPAVFLWRHSRMPFLLGWIAVFAALDGVLAYLFFLGRIV